MSILITGGSTAGAYRLERLLVPMGDIFFGDHLPLPGITSGLRRFISIPQGSSPFFVHALLSICLDHEIRKIYPLCRCEILPLAASKQLYSEFDICVIVPSLSYLEDLAIYRPAAGSRGLAVIENGRVIASETGIEDMPVQDDGIYFFPDPHNYSDHHVFTVD